MDKDYISESKLPGWVSKESKTKLLTLVVLLILAMMLVSACTSQEPAEHQDNADVADLEHQDEEEHDEDGPAAHLKFVGLEGLVDLQLSGQLAFLRQLPEGQTLMVLDMATGEVETAFQAPPYGWITGATLAGDGRGYLLSYAPPPGEGGAQSGYTELSVLPVGGGDLELAVGRTKEKQAFSAPQWTPDGRFIYFNYYEVKGEGQTEAQYSVGRQSFPDGNLEILVENAIWPRLSGDGSRLVYVTIVSGIEENELFVLNLSEEGSAPQQIVLPVELPIVDAPLFSPDGQLIYFSAQSPEEAAPLSWLERLAGVQIALAHNVPSDWWRVPVAGGEPERLTEIFQSGMYAAFSPDGNHLAFISSTGLHVMPADGGEVLTLVEAPDFYGTLDWVP
jgi:Tol biopolymer transport system component